MSFLSGLFGGGKSASTQQTAAVGLQVQTSVQGKPLALVYGMTRVAPNLIWYGDFTATQQSSSVGGKGGLTGGGGKGGGSGSYVYSASFQRGAWRRPDQRNLRTSMRTRASRALSDLGMSFFPGFYQQQPWSYLHQRTRTPDTPNLTPSSPVAPIRSRPEPAVSVRSRRLDHHRRATYTMTRSAHLPTGRYNYRPTPSSFASVTYYFNSGDNAGKTVQVSYKNNGVPDRP